MPNFMLLGQKTSELGGGLKYAPPRVWSVFKSPGKIGLKGPVLVSQQYFLVFSDLCPEWGWKQGNILAKTLFLSNTNVLLHTVVVTVPFNKKDVLLHEVVNWEKFSWQQIPVKLKSNEHCRSGEQTRNIC